MTNWYSYFKTHWWGLVVALYSLIRLVPIMLLKLPIVLWSNAPEFCLLCSKYAPHVKHYALQIQHLFILCYINYKIMSINSLSSCQHTIKSLPMNVHKHFEFIFVLFATLVQYIIWQNHYSDYTTDSPKSFIQISQSCEYVHAYNFNNNCSSNCYLLCWHYPQCFWFPIMFKIMLA